MLCGSVQAVQKAARLRGRSAPIQTVLKGFRRLARALH
jgi:hypothetical protein